MTTRRIFVALGTAATALLAACGGGETGTPLAPDSAVAAAAATFSGALQPAPAGISGNVTCNNLALGAVSVDSVIVPANAACQLRGTRLTGSILVNGQAVLDAADVQVTGNLQADGAADVLVHGASSFGGSVQIKQGAGATVRNARITGDLQFDAQRGAVLADGNRVGGNLQAFGNRGGVTLTDNTMNGNLQCKENLPAPVVANNVAALIEDQCVPGSGTGGGGAGGGGSGSGGTVPAPPGLSGNVTCRNLSIGAVSLDTVTVPEGASCTLQGTQLIGSILIGPNASLTASDIAVNGNIQADGAASVTVIGRSTAGGSVQVKQGGSASISGMQIGGDLQFDAQRGTVSAAGNRVTGNLQAFGNRGGLSLIGNAINGNLQCNGNVPAPTGSGNTAALKQDQCRLL